jgi:hypothetical protein
MRESLETLELVHHPEAGGCAKLAADLVYRALIVSGGTEAARR